ncbi:MAG: endolytic transglycosylase MltG [Pikeienuella sp.]
MKHLVANALTLLIVLCLCVAGAGYVGVKKFDAEGPLSEAKLIEIKGGATINAAAEMLLAEGVIDSASVFRMGARYKGVHNQLKFGEYEIPAGSSMDDVLSIIISGKSLQYKITVAEGLTSWEVVELLKASDLLSGEIAEIPAEGVLAPDTYFVAKGADREGLLRRMRTAQMEILKNAWDNRQPGLPISSPEEALILASIIEKETGVGAEREMVAGVFVNRLVKRMRLQSDPTIIYGITLGQGPLGRSIRRSDISRATPYNTYVIDRLPPGPIANPGRETIVATLNPAETKALFFVADGTGGHAFAETLRQHEKNVAAWRKIERARKSQ